MAATVFILGAGASCAFGLPTAQGLTDLICRNPVPTSEVYGPLTANDYANFRSTLARSGRSSVDAFLETRSDLMAIGKAVIARTLLPQERIESLFDDWPRQRLHPRTRDVTPGHWYELLFNMLTEGRPFEEIDFADLRIITFNYDRSLEHYLYTALQNSYGRSPEETAVKANELKINHVYGSLGRLPWQPGTIPAVPYGRSSSNDVIQAADTLKILHETTHDTAEFEKARESIAQARHVYFLGFGFSDANLRRLAMNKPDIPADKFGGTILGLAPTKIYHLRRSFAGLALLEPDTQIVWQDKDVYNYLRDHIGR